MPDPMVTAPSPTDAGEVGREQDMGATRDTVPGVGTVHHCLTHAGQRFGVLRHNDGRRELFFSASGESDKPSHTLVLDHDEAEQLADLLHSDQATRRRPLCGPP
ncbi:hypothetical protein Atai01_19990 [Amycolatopsis taiwanensis]|uniref:Potassium/proton antiporter subunit KhtT-like N-terminal domain-containing protein n=2 Tax=Amycolatopsis taiwanensis TaxID=342230 RepID=A0A9W6R0M9_9PSEU|nr:hypothetical protein Atai01_19990 [Amycolatopsis taiwanensis]